MAKVTKKKAPKKSPGKSLWMVRDGDKKEVAPEKIERMKAMGFVPCDNS